MGNFFLFFCLLSFHLFMQSFHIVLHQQLKLHQTRTLAWVLTVLIAVSPTFLGFWRQKKKNSWLFHCRAGLKGQGGQYWIAKLADSLLQQNCIGNCAWNTFVKKIKWNKKNRQPHQKENDVYGKQSHLLFFGKTKDQLVKVGWCFAKYQKTPQSCKLIVSFTLKSGLVGKLWQTAHFNESEAPFPCLRNESRQQH